MSSELEAYTSAFKKLKGPDGKPVTPIWPSEKKEFAKAHNISPNIHKPLEEILGHQPLEGFVEKFNVDTENTGYTLPGTKYEGPGNSVNLGAPRNHGDTVARGHDLKYLEAQYLLDEGLITRDEFDGKIYQSDKEAVSDFNKGDTFGDVLGKDGLQIKRLGELFTDHPIYPNPGKLCHWTTREFQHIFMITLEQMLHILNSNQHILLGFQIIQRQEPKENQQLKDQHSQQQIHHKTLRKRQVVQADQFQPVNLVAQRKVHKVYRLRQATQKLTKL